MAVVLSYIILLKVPLFIYHGCACLLQSKLETASLVQMQDGHFGPEESLFNFRATFYQIVFCPLISSFLPYSVFLVPQLEYILAR